MAPACLQYDEYDNALNVMITHSPIAWEHVKFKDVAVKVRGWWCGGGMWAPLLPGFPSYGGGVMWGG